MPVAAAGRVQGHQPVQSDRSGNLSSTDKKCWGAAKVFFALLAATLGCVTFGLHPGMVQTLVGGGAVTSAVLAIFSATKDPDGSHE